MATSSPSPTFTVRRCKPELVIPAKPTPHECKLLSDIDDQELHRLYLPFIVFYRKDHSMQGEDPVRVIKEALAKILVFYYPLAGRLREGSNGNLTVDCTSEGVWFTEADADITLNQLGAIQPPFPYYDELDYDFPRSQGILNCPLLSQVTRLNCGGFIFAGRFNHVMMDGIGLKLFVSTLAEMAHGAASPSVPPSWERHLLNACHPPRVTFTHHEYEQVESTVTPSPDDMVEIQRSFFFGDEEISSLRQLLPNRLRQCSKFKLLAACLWRCRTIALNFSPDQDVRVIVAVNIRSKLNPPLPSGYYGNGLVFSAAKTTAEKLCQNPLGYAVELVKEANGRVTEEYVRSTAALMVITGKRISCPEVGSFLISDITDLGYEDIDFGWGKAIFAGTGNTFGPVSSFISTIDDEKNKIGSLVPINLPAPAMERFANQLDIMLNAGNHSKL